MTAETYVKAYVFGLAGLFALVALFNRVVDPFWYYRDISVDGFNAVKTQFHKYERHIKPILLQEKQPEVVVFSNSSLEVGFNPSHPGLTHDGAYRVYNFGIGAAIWDRVFCNVLYALEHTDMRVTVIGMHPGPLPVADCAAQFAEMDGLRQAKLLLTFDALKASYKTVTQQDRKPTHTLDGLFFFHRDERGKVEQAFDGYFHEYMALRSSCGPAGRPDSPVWDYPVGTADMAGLNYLLRRFGERNIEVKLVIYPLHALWMEMATACRDAVALGRWQYLRQMAAAVEQAGLRGGQVELWDFQGFSSFMTERIRDNQTRYWQDHGHFNYEMGDVMLDTIFHRRVSGLALDGDVFGVALTAQSVRRRFDAFYEARQRFIERNPWFVEDLARFADGQSSR